MDPKLCLGYYSVYRTEKGKLRFYDYCVPVRGRLLCCVAGQHLLKVLVTRCSSTMGDSTFSSTYATQSSGVGFHH